MVRLPQAVSEDLRTVSLAQVGILFCFLGVSVTKGVVKCNVFTYTALQLHTGKLLLCLISNVKFGWQYLRSGCKIV